MISDIGKDSVIKGGDADEYEDVKIQKGFVPNKIIDMTLFKSNISIEDVRTTENVLKLSDEIKAHRYEILF